MIRVIDNYGISADANCFAVGEIGTIVQKNKNGEQKEYETLKNARYYPTFDKALASLKKRMQIDAVRNMDLDFADALAALRASNERLEKAITDALNEIGGGTKDD